MFKEEETQESIHDTYVIFKTEKEEEEETQEPIHEPVPEGPEANGEMSQPHCQSNRTQGKKRRKKDPTVFGDEVERELVQQLKTWIESCRTRLGKITESRSGQAALKLTDRDKWIKQMFGFLEEHIVRCPTRQSAKFPDATTSTATTAAQDGVLSSSDEWQDTPAPTSEASSTGVQQEGGLEQEDVLIARVLACTQQDEALRQKVSVIQTKSTQEEARQKLFSYMAVEAREVHPALWDNYVSDAMALLHRYKAKSREMAQRRAQQQPHPPAPH
ncbi:hypothetical protein GWK47_029426 [Chionoecetes opilio]|uniref:Uncharacterized protein n=1 Tax=Chionoecetes opilio TaxID=41210 RepID=A0A8J4Z466_CHIOP|nr:hypothetical protein GWK47_029426 [Chionoecetes opilio]